MNMLKINLLVCLLVICGLYSNLQEDSQIYSEQQQKTIPSDLSISAFKQTDFVAGISQWQYPDFDYTFKEAINFRLENAPDGMELDMGRLSWAAPDTDESKSYTVKLTTLNDRLSKPINFTVKVAKTAAIHKEIKGNTLFLMDESCKFNTVGWGDFSITANDRDIDKLHKSTFRKVISDVDYHIPSTVKRLSCFFKAHLSYQNNSGDDYKVTLPIQLKDLPDGYPLETIKLYTYDTLKIMDGDGTHEGHFSNVWVPTSYFVNVKQTDAGNYLEFKTSSLNADLLFIGYEHFDISTLIPLK